MGDLFLTFPVLGVDFLGSGTKTIKSTLFIDVTDFILDVVGKTGIEVMMQGAITVSLNLGCNLIEVNHIAIDVLGVLHLEMIELMLGIGNGVVGTECGLELYDKLMPTGHPQGTCVRVFHP